MRPSQQVCYLSIAPIALILLFITPCAFGQTSYDIGAGKPYSIILLGDSGSNKDDDHLNIESNSSIFGSVLKGMDDKPFMIKLSTSKVMGGWDVETGVARDITSSYTGSQNEISEAQMDLIRDDAIAASNHWAAQAGTDLTAAQHTLLAGGGNLTLTGTTGGANIFNSIDDFTINGVTLTLSGGVGDFFIFNIRFILWMADICMKVYIVPRSASVENLH